VLAAPGIGRVHHEVGLRRPGLRAVGRPELRPHEDHEHSATRVDGQAQYALREGLGLAGLGRGPGGDRHLVDALLEQPCPLLDVVRHVHVELEALESLLQRLADKLRSEQAFAAQAAHSLRTPLAGLAAQLEVARLSAPADLRPRLDQALAAARRLTGVVGGLLALGRATGPVEWQTFDARELARVALGGGVEVDTAALQAAPRLAGNLDLLGVAVANLVDNAARHGAACARISAVHAGGLQRIRVVDDGPGVNRERLQALRSALARDADHGEVDGAVGLGLTLAAAVAHAHGGRVELDCNAEGHAGFCVQITWPASPPKHTTVALSPTARSGGG